MVSLHPRIVCLVVAAVLSAPATVWLQQPEPPPRPKLIVLITVDQMRSDYITWYGAQWSGGLRRLVREGAWFTEAAYPYMNTVTCAGHATIATGTFPYRHGVVLNEWWSRELGRDVTCTDDVDVAGIGYGAEVHRGHSARWLETTTLAEELQSQFGPSARVVTMSLKARSAIMLAGRRGTAITWFDEASGVWATSKAFTDKPVSLVSQFAQTHPVEADCGQVWRRLLPAEKYLFADEMAGERPRRGWKSAFPHELGGQCSDGGKPGTDFYLLWERSPLADAALARMAAAAVDALQLGRGETTDFLGVSFSALDLVGHWFGPRSHEVQDVLVQLDRSLGELLAHLDEKVGADNYVVAFSADHGVSEIPEQGGGGRLSAQQLAREAEQVLDRLWGEGNYIASIKHTDLYFQPGIYSRLRADAETMAAMIAALEHVPGVARVLRSEELSRLRASNDAIARAAALSYFPARSGDLIIIPQPGWITSSDAATHGTNYDYDARVPVIFLGAGIRPGRYPQPSSPADIAPTLAYLVGLRFTERDGRVLYEAFRDSVHPE